VRGLQCACIVGAVRVLSPPIAREPSNVSDPVREPVRADEFGQVGDAQASVTVQKAAADPPPVGSLPPTRLAYAAVPDVTFDPTSYTSPLLKRETPDFSYLADYAYSEVPPPETPADTVLRALKEIPEGTPREEVRRAAQTFGLDVTFMEAVAKIESEFDPKQRTGSYIGLYQLSKYENI
jgi:soluble lytic murein transglycosylase-like protein